MRSVLGTLVLLVCACGGRSALELGGGGGSAAPGATTSTGSGPALACQPGEAPVLLATGASTTSAIAADGADVYFAGGSHDSIRRVSRLGGDVTTFAAQQDHPSFITLDATRVYWSNTCGLGDCGVFSLDKAGGAGVTFTNQPNATALAVDGDSLYWLVASATAPEGRIQRAPREGGAAAELAGGLGFLWSIALDDTFVYFLDTVGQAIGRVRKTGGAPEMLADGEGVQSIAVDQALLFWGVGSSPGTGYVVSMPKEDAAQTPVATGLDGPIAVTLDVDHVFVAAQGVFDGTRWSGAVLEVAKHDGEPKVIASAQSPTSLAVDDACVYWVNTDGNLWRAAK